MNRDVWPKSTRKSSLFRFFLMKCKVNGRKELDKQSKNENIWENTEIRRGIYRKMLFSSCSTTTKKKTDENQNIFVSEATKMEHILNIM